MFSLIIDNALDSEYPTENALRQAIWELRGPRYPTLQGTCIYLDSKTDFAADDDLAFNMQRDEDEYDARQLRDEWLATREGKD